MMDESFIFKKDYEKKSGPALGIHNELFDGIGKKLDCECFGLLCSMGAVGKNPLSMEEINGLTKLKMDKKKFPSLLNKLVKNKFLEEMIEGEKKYYRISEINGEPMFTNENYE